MTSVKNHGSQSTKMKKGTGYEWRSSSSIFGVPIVHIAYGKDEKGKRRVAKGILAIGQFSFGLIAIGQIGIGILLGLGQVSTGLFALGQVAIGGLFGIGQVAFGLFAIGQLAMGVYALCQYGWASYLWSPKHVDMEAVAMFSTIWSKLKQLIGL